MGYLVLSIDSHGKRFDCGQVQSVQAIDMLVGVLNTVHRRFKREVKNQQ